MTDAMAGFIRNAELASIQINMKFPAGYPEHQKDNLEEIFKEAGRESGCKVQVRDVSSLSKKAFSNNYILDSIYAVPWIIRSNLKKGHEQKFINAVYDSDKEAGMLHGGNGIITVNNIKKPAYYAYMCLSRLGDEIIYNSEGYIVTKRNQDIIVLLYDYDSDCFVDAEEYSDWKTLADFKPVTEKNMEYKLDFSNLQGKYTVTELRIGSDMCLFRKMAEMGMPETLMPEEERCMRYFLGPQLDFAVIESSGGTASMEVKVPKYGATLLQLHKTIV
jgi:xylan 1,4-beta-xylosidase